MEMFVFPDPLQVFPDHVDIIVKIVSLLHKICIDFWDSNVLHVKNATASNSVKTYLTNRRFNHSSQQACAVTKKNNNIFYEISILW